jgi:hypothetical protein
MSSRARFVSSARVTVVMAVITLALVVLAGAPACGQGSTASVNDIDSASHTSFTAVASTHSAAARASRESAAMASSALHASNLSSSSSSSNSSGGAKIVSPSHSASGDGNTSNASFRSHASGSNSNASTPITSTTTTPEPTPKPIDTRKPEPPIDNNDTDDGMTTFVFIVIIFFIIGAILYGSRAVPRTCPFFRGAGAGTGGVGGIGRRGAAPRTQQYARLDGGAFYGDEEDYRGMEPSSAAVNALRSYSPLRGGTVEGDGRGDVVVEMQEKLKADAGVEPVMGRVSGVSGASAKSPFPPRENAVQALGVVDRNPAALDALFGTTASSTSATSPAPIPLPSKNSLKAMRKGKLGHAVSTKPLGATKAGSNTSESQHKDNWDWSDEDK